MTLDEFRRDCREEADKVGLKVRVSYCEDDQTVIVTHSRLGQVGLSQVMTSAELQSYKESPAKAIIGTLLAQGDAIYARRR